MNRSPLDLSPFKELKGVIDIIYNPARTNLIMQAESLGVPCIGGIRMLVGQAAKSAELFDNVETTRRRVNNIASELTRRKMNIVLVGMPGSGKTRIARSLAQNLGWPMLDTDEMIIQRTGRSPSDIIINDGEPAFRDIEMEIIEDTALTANCIISTGGGCITRSENYYPLHRNSLVVWIRRDLALLSTEDRPLSQTADISFMYQKRYPMYEYFSDMIVENNGSIEDAVNEIVRASGVEILED